MAAARAVTASCEKSKGKGIHMETEASKACECGAIIALVLWSR